ncbi:unnamed protein product [Lota lota]
MADPTQTPDPVVVSSTLPDPALVVDPSVLDGRCEQADATEQQQEAAGESQAEGFKMDQEMKITDSIEDQGGSN